MALVAALQSAAADYRLETVAENLTWPWCIAFLPDGDMLVTERDGDLHVIRAGILDPLPVPGVPPAYVRSQGGLFDVLLHPRFEENRLPLPQPRPRYAGRGTRRGSCAAGSTGRR